MLKSLVIGMGIGCLYRDVLKNLGYDVVTVDLDPSKGADYTDYHEALTGLYTTVHICTPNFTHEEIARAVAPFARIVFVEKPGVQNRADWLQLDRDFTNTRFIMVKNNQWRDNVSELKQLADRAVRVNIEWTRRNCIPNPGSWFTTKKLAYGGVSCDLMPHMLSWYIALDDNWGRDTVEKSAHQQWQLNEIDSTEYGTVNPNGVYDVDDVCTIKFGDKWTLSANWRSMDTEKSAIDFVMADDTVETFELGWCPESAYQAMIADAVKNIDNEAWWYVQLIQDCWIHEQIEAV
jgi:predicted dehydrogenase